MTEPGAESKKVLGDTVISVKGLSKRYKIEGREEDVVALKDINLCDDGEFYAIKRGEFVILRGPSGGGKTTLLNMLGTIDRPSTGTLEILGQVIDDSVSDAFLARLRLERIGFVFQTFNLIATMSAFENVELPMTLKGGMKKAARKARVTELLQWVGLGDRMSHLPSELSGGEQQRVTIARALANKPDLLLLDEATGDLDTRNTVEVMDLLLRINHELKTTCVMVTHNGDLECYGDRLLYISDGRFVRQALNVVQTALPYEDYIQFLNSQDGGGSV
eukprot:c53579_g1_i1.p1 GENE.c53579_g1_i1~~c53579_g1_i1.p1  ORF type:complete len:299 (-),score=69.96 c53579_g1_i1:60-887(-)